MLLHCKYGFHTISAALLLLAMSTAGSTTHAQTLEWYRGVDGDFLNSSMWSPSQEPTSSHDLIFGMPAGGGGTFTVSAPDGSSFLRARSMVVDPFRKSGNPLNMVFDVKSRVFRLGLQSDPSLIVGDADSGQAQLTVIGRQFDSSTTILGRASGTHGTLVLGDETQRTILGSGHGNGLADMIIGDAGYGQLNLQRANVRTDDVRIGVQNNSQGHVRLYNDSIWRHNGSASNDKRLDVGVASYGNIALHDQAVLESDDVMLGVQSSGVGNMSLQGQSRWEVDGRVTIGQSGSGSIALFDQAQVDSQGNSVWLGAEQGSQGTIHVLGSDASWTNITSLNIGRTEKGTLNIAEGGMVASTWSHIARGRNSDAVGTVTVRGEDSTWNASQLRTGRSELASGAGGDATLHILDGGTVVSSSAQLSVSHSSTTEVLIEGENSTWTINSNLFVGGDGAESGGAADVTIGFGGTVAAHQSQNAVLRLHDEGTVNLQGGRLDARAIDFAGGTLNFLAGRLHLVGDQTVTASDLSNIFNAQGPAAGQHFSIAGHATLLGAPLQIVGGTFSVGSLSGAEQLDFQTGTLNITGEDGLTIGLGETFGDIVQVHANQTFNVSHTANIASTGVLKVDHTASFGGQTIDNQGEIILDGQFARLNGNTLDNHGSVIGHGRINARLNNHAAGQVRVQNGDRLVLTAADNVNAGQIFVRQAELFIQDNLSNTGNLVISDGGGDVFGHIINEAAGRISVAGDSTGQFFGEVENAGDVIVTQGSKAVFYGDVSGAGDFSGDGLVEFAAGFSPGNSPGEVSFGGDVRFTSEAELVIELGGTEQGSLYDYLDITGQAMLDGTLKISLLDDFMPTFGDTFQIMSFADSIGQFDEVIGLNLGALYFELVEQGDQLTLETMASPGNMNLDQHIDFDDINPFMLALNDPAAYEAQYGIAPHAVGDVNGDGQFDFDDINPFVSLLEGGTTVVPEPGTLAMLAAGGLMLLRRRRAGGVR